LCNTEEGLQSISRRLKIKDGVGTLPLLQLTVLNLVAGIFAGNKKIPKGTFIGIYAGEIIREAEAEQRGEYVSEV